MENQQPDPKAREKYLSGLEKELPSLQLEEKYWEAKAKIMEHRYNREHYNIRYLQLLQMQKDALENAQKEQSTKEGKEETKSGTA